MQLNGELFEQQQLSLCLPFLPAGFIVNGMIVGYRILILCFWLHIYIFPLVTARGQKHTRTMIL